MAETKEISMKDDVASLLDRIESLSVELEPRKKDLTREVSKWPTQSAPIAIPKRKIVIEPPWIENTGWIKYQEWLKHGPTY